MAKGIQIRELLESLVRQDIDLEGSGIQGTGREMVPASEGVEQLRKIAWLEKNHRTAWYDTWYAHDDPTKKAESGPVHGFAKGGPVKAIVDATKRDLEILRQYHQGSTVQPGVFSTLDELIKDAPQDMTGDQWLAYLTPGRVLKREGIQFPLKKEELQFASEGGLEDLVAGQGTMTRDELRALINKNRMPFEATVARENFDIDGEFIEPDYVSSLPPRWQRFAEKYDIVEDVLPEISSTYRELSGTRYNLGPLSGLQIDRARWGAGHSAESRLFTKTPGSSYEESVTRIPTVSIKQSHFSPDTMAWSRTSSHDYRDPTIEGPLQTVRVRLVDEIQSDAHRQAAKFHFEDDAGDYLSPRQFREMYGDLSFAPKGWKKVKQGYFTNETKIQLEDLEDQLNVIEEQLNTKRQEGVLDEDPYIIERQEAKNEVIDEIATISDMVPDIPYKSPGDYAALELRKQLVNAVENGERFLALVRGRDQIQRYSGMSEAEQASSKYFYDNIYRKELQKLANRYGAPIVDIDLQVGQMSDLRLSNMIEFNAEGWQDFMDMSISFMSEVNNRTAIDMAMGSLGKDVRQLHSRMAYDHYDATPHMDGARNRLSEIDNELEQLQKTLNDSYENVISGTSGPGRPYDPTSVTGTQAWDRSMNRLKELGEELDNIYERYTEAVIGDETVIKSFPALKITDEVNAKVTNIGVSQYALGGLVRKYQEGGLVREKEVRQRPGGLSVFSMLGPGDDLGEEQVQEVMTGLREAGYNRETQEMMGTWDYWKDVAKRVPAIMSSMWKTLNEETGEAEWKFPMQPMRPYPGISEEDIEGMLEYNEMVRQHNLEVRPGIIDDTIGIAALPYAGYNWAFRGKESDEPVEIPESIMEALGRSAELMETVEQDWGLGMARGLPQHMATGLGVMLGQVPTPKSIAEAIFGGVAKVARPVTRRLPDAVRKAGAVAMFPVKAGAEFFDPTVNPSFKNYLIGSGFGAGLGVIAEAVSDEPPRNYEEVKADRELRELQEKQYFDTIANYTQENWDGLPMETRLSMLSNDDAEVNTAVWEALTQEQQHELLRAADAAGMFEMETDDAE